MQQENPIDWRPIPGFVGYRITEYGGLLRHGRIIATRSTSKGYLVAHVRRNDGRILTRKIHCLVLEAFVGPCPAGHECGHTDGNPSNNHVSNLRWVTPRQNMLDRIRHGHGSVPPTSAKLSEVEVRRIRESYGANCRLKELSQTYGVSISSIWRVVHRAIWRNII